MIHVDRYEKGWIAISIAVLIVFGIAVSVAGFMLGIEVPVPEQRVDPRTVATPGMSPFGEPGVRQLAPGRYEAHILAQIWLFNPREIRIPAGSTITFYITSIDVQHGFLLQDTNINMMVIPGEVSRLTATFDEPGTYNFVCHEYCGIGHQGMYGSLIVE